MVVFLERIFRKNIEFVGFNRKKKKIKGEIIEIDILK